MDEKDQPELTRKACRLFQTLLGIWIPRDTIVDIGSTRTAPLGFVEFSEVEAMLQIALEDDCIPSVEEDVTSNTPARNPALRPYENPRFHEYYSTFPMRYLSEPELWLLVQQDAPEVLHLIMDMPVFNVMRHEFEVQHFISVL